VWPTVRGVVSSDSGEHPRGKNEGVICRQIDEEGSFKELVKKALGTKQPTMKHSATRRLAKEEKVDWGQPDRKAER